MHNDLDNIFNTNLDDRNDELIEESKESRKKKVHINKNAGNVEFNVSAFNHAMGADAAGAVSGGEACSCGESLEDCVYTNLNEDMLNEAGYNLKTINSKLNIASKLFSKQMKPLLLADNNFNTPDVVNAGKRYDEDKGAIDIAAENNSVPKPGFSIKANIGGANLGDLYKTTIEHHIFGVVAARNSINGSQNSSASNNPLSTFTLSIPLGLHTALHNKANRVYLDAIDKNQKINDIYTTYVKNSEKIKHKDSCIYSARSGLLIREYEYCLRAMAQEVNKDKNLNKLWLTAVANETAKAISGENIDSLLNMKNSAFLKIKTDNGDVDVLPIITIISNDDKTWSDTEARKILDTDGVYLKDIKDSSEYYIQIIVLGSSDGKYSPKVYSVDELDSIRATTVSESLLEDNNNLKEITLADIRNILVNNYRIKSKDRNIEKKSDTVLSSIVKGMQSMPYGSYDNRAVFSADVSDTNTDKNKNFEINLANVVKDFVSDLKSRDFKIYTSEDIESFSPRNSSLYKLNDKQIIVRKNNIDYSINKAMNVNVDFDVLLQKIINNDLINTNMSNPIFLDENGNPVIGIDITKTSPFRLLSVDDFDYSKIKTVDLNNMTLQMIHNYATTNISAKDSLWSAIKSALTNEKADIDTLVWNKKLGNRANAGQFENTHIHKIENLFDTVTSVGDKCFAHSWIKEAIMPQIRTINEEAFAYCWGLTKLYIGKYISDVYVGIIRSSTACNVYFGISKNQYDHKLTSSTKYVSGISKNWGKGFAKSIVFDSSINNHVTYVDLLESLTEEFNEDIKPNVFKDWEICLAKDFTTDSNTNLANFVNNTSGIHGIIAKHSSNDDSAIYILDREYAYKWDLASNSPRGYIGSVVNLLSTYPELKEYLIFTLGYYKNCKKFLDNTNTNSLKDAESKYYDFNLYDALATYCYSYSDKTLYKFLEAILDNNLNILLDKNYLKVDRNEKDKEKDEIKKQLLAIDLSSTVAKPLVNALTAAGLSIDDYYDKLRDETDDRFENLAMNAYWRTVIKHLRDTYIKELVAIFKKRNAIVDVKSEFLKIPYTAIIDIFIATVDEYNFENVPTVGKFDSTRINNELRELSNKKFDLTLWLSEFAKYFSENLKNY